VIVNFLYSVKNQGESGLLEDPVVGGGRRPKEGMVIDEGEYG
jgi:hypothetical protein